MPFPFKKKPEDIGAPEPMEGMRKQPMMAKKPMPGMGKEMPEEEPAAPAGDIGSLGEKYGLAPEETNAFAREIMQHFMGMCGSAEAPEVNESETEEYPA